MLAVVDTNVLVSGLLSETGPPAAVLHALAESRLVPVVCHAVMAEYQHVLLRPRLRLQGGDVQALLLMMQGMARWVNVAAYAGEPPVPDTGDWPFIACALAMHCPVITGNVRHFPAALGITALTPRQWLDGH